MCASPSRCISCCEGGSIYVRYPSAESDLPKTRDFVHKGLLLNHERAFRVVEVELSFLADYFHTTYPVLFSDGIPILHTVVFVVFLTSFALLGRKLVNYRTPEDDDNHNHIMRVHVNVEVLITAVMLIASTLKALWDNTTYLFSQWMKVVLLCKYVEKASWQKSMTIEKILGFVCRRNVRNCSWRGKMDVYSLLDSLDYNPWNLSNIVTLGAIAKAKRAAKKGSPIRVPGEVKKAIADSLRANGGQLSNGISSLQRNGVVEAIFWACGLETHTHTILVWHIATALCEMAMPPESLKNFLVDMKFYHVVAMSLSRYCAYLVAFSPAFLPDQTYAAEFIFDNVAREARKFLEGRKSRESRVEKMMGVGDDGLETIIEKGAKLGRQLITRIGDERLRWKVLADFWAEMLLYVAPSDDTPAHKRKLGEGGEFITHVWALLSHAGII